LKQEFLVGLIKEVMTFKGMTLLGILFDLFVEIGSKGSGSGTNRAKPDCTNLCLKIGRLKWIK
jgi:hypothetical protein